MIALISQDVAKEFENITNIKTLALPRYDKLDIPVSSHADMLVFVLDEYIFLYEDYYNKNKELFKAIYGYKIICVSKECKIKYPYDIGLNVLTIGNKIFCNVQYTANEILDLAKARGYKIINVKQGYSACSTLVINENSAITGDKGMYNSLIKEGIDTLLIAPDEIKLDGYNHGFIGGSVGVLDKKAYFFGDVYTLSDGEKIFNFLQKHQCEIVLLPRKELSDFGGIKFIKW